MYCFKKESDFLLGRVENSLLHVVTEGADRWKTPPPPPVTAERKANKADTVKDEGSWRDEIDVTDVICETTAFRTT